MFFQLCNKINETDYLITSFKLQINTDFLKNHGPLCDKSLIENWKYVALIAEDLHNMISKSNKKIRSMLSQVPTKGKNLN